MKNNIIYIVIATSLKRTDMLINKALYSVYRQQNINPKNIKVLIVDDNKDAREIINIKIQIKILREKLCFTNKNIFHTTILKNQRTPYRSGTGSWNTAIEIINQNENKNSYIAILDDDDHYSDNYLNILFDTLKKKPKTIAIFSPLTKCFKEYEEIFTFTKKDLTAENFFIGNPGIQGSNMFFKSTILKNINAFDEALNSATDRDLMIRFIDYVTKKSLFENIEILTNSYVFYNANNNNSITHNLEKKHLGLDTFYKKHTHMFSNIALNASLERAKKLFNYHGKETLSNNKDYLKVKIYLTPTDTIQSRTL